MSETSDPTRPTPPLEPLPESFSIPHVLVGRWLRLPTHAQIQVEHHRGDLDDFYNSLNRCIEAQYVFQDCIVDYTAGRLEEANWKLRQAQRRLIEAQNALRQFMAAIMASAALEPRS
jgi:hypothetical protein